ncbi:hypothetical protein [Streptomyces sp. NBC_00648]
MARKARFEPEPVALIAVILEESTLRRTIGTRACWSPTPRR